MWQVIVIDYICAVIIPCLVNTSCYTTTTMGVASGGIVSKLPYIVVY